MKNVGLIYVTLYQHRNHFCVQKYSKVFVCVRIYKYVV
jgi:hypothetical protein